MRPSLPFPEMSEEFLTLAGPAPARGDLDRWRQVALLGVSTAAYGDERARVGLAAALLALDCPVEAGRLLATVEGDDPWARWWTVLAVGQSPRAEGLDAALTHALESAPSRGADGREIARRLADLQAELADLAGTGDGTARFTVLGHRARPTRRALIGGRSSAVFLLDPSWEALQLVRLAPGDGPSTGNGAHLAYEEILELVRRGEPGASRRVPDDVPPRLAPGPMLDALKEDPATRDGRLLQLATEVQKERQRLAAERAELAEARLEIAAERRRLRQAREAAEATAPNGGAAKRAPKSVPKTPEEAAMLLGVAVGASQSTIQRHWRDQVAKCHPDLVTTLHPSLRRQAEELAVALNAARDLLLGRSATRRPARRA